MLFFKKKNTPSGQSATPYDPDTQEPVLRCSICNGEQVAGFKDRGTGAFTEVMLVRTPADLETFRTRYGIGDGEIRKVY